MGAWKDCEAGSGRLKLYSVKRQHVQTFRLKLCDMFFSCFAMTCCEGQAGQVVCLVSH